MAEYFSQRVKANQQMIRGRAQIWPSGTSLHTRLESISQISSKEIAGLLNLLNAQGIRCDVYITLNQRPKTGCSSELHAVLKIRNYLGKWEDLQHEACIPTQLLAAVEQQLTRLGGTGAFQFPRVSVLLITLSPSIPLINLAVRVPVGRGGHHESGLPAVYSWQYFLTWS